MSDLHTLLTTAFPRPGWSVARNPQAADGYHVAIVCEHLPYVSPAYVAHSEHGVMLVLDAACNRVDQSKVASIIREHFRALLVEHAERLLAEASALEARAAALGGDEVPLG